MPDQPLATAAAVLSALTDLAPTSDPRRRSPRLACQLPVKVDFLDILDRHARAVLIDISRHGALISPLRGLALHEHLRLHRVSHAPIDGRVVAITEHGVHVEFTNALPDL